MNEAGIELQFNFLSGEIPVQIGLLTELGTFVCSVLAPVSRDALTCTATPLACSHTLFACLHLVKDHLRLDRNQFTGEFTCEPYVGFCLVSCVDQTNEACRSL